MNSSKGGDSKESETWEDEQVGVKEAVQVAKNYVMELFGEEGIVDIGLEEVDFDQSDN